MCGVTHFRNQDTVQCLYTITQYTRYTLLQQCHNCNTVHHKLYTLNQVTVQYQLCSTILTYCTVHSLHLYIHTPYLYLHLKYITVHRTFSDTTVQLYLRTVYILGEQYTVHTRLTVHSTRMKIQMHSTLLFIQY